MAGEDAPLDVLVVDAVADRYDTYRNLLSGLARRVVTVPPGEDAWRLYDEGGFGAALLHLDGAAGDAGADLAALSASLDTGLAPPVIVISDQMPELGSVARGASAGLLDYLPASHVPQLLASRISCLVELRRVRSELARRDTQIDELGRALDRMTAAVAEERRTSQVLRDRVGEQIHRSKNMLAIMQSIAHRTISDGRQIRDARDALLGRLRTLSRAYHLVAKADGEGADLAEVVEGELADVHDRVAVSGPAVRLAPSVVQTLALAVHELAANAVQHGALGSPAGTVAVGWTFFEYGADRFLEVAWVERGSPPLAAPPPSYGFGLTLVSSFRGRHGAEPNIVFGAEGLTCRMRLSQDVIVAG